MPASFTEIRGRAVDRVPDASLKVMSPQVVFHPFIHNAYLLYCTPFTHTIEVDNIKFNVQNVDVPLNEISRNYDTTTKGILA